MFALGHIDENVDVTAVLAQCYAGLGNFSFDVTFVAVKIGEGAQVAASEGFFSESSAVGGPREDVTFGGHHDFFEFAGTEDLVAQEENFADANFFVFFDFSESFDQLSQKKIQCLASKPRLLPCRRVKPFEPDDSDHSCRRDVPCPCDKQKISRKNSARKWAPHDSR